VTATEPAAAPAPAAEPALRCPQCGNELVPGQDWCLRCGRAATTTVVRPRHWKIPMAVVAVLAALAGVGVAVLFVALSGDDENIVTTGELTRTITVTTQAPTAAPPPAPTTTAPTTTAPTTPRVPTTPGATTPTPTVPTTPRSTTTAPRTGGTTTGSGGSSSPAD
jgi:hypothetical protein